MDKSRSVAPIIAAVLLLLPVLYVGSYLALVVPRGMKVVRTDKLIIDRRYRIRHYRIADAFVCRVYWPLEQIDRKLRPDAWSFGKIGLEKQGGGLMLLKS